MKTLKTIFGALGGAWLLATSVQAGLNLVVTTPDLASIAREVGGSQVRITTLARPTEDPHFVDAKPSFIVKLNRADALVEGGADLEVGWLPPLLAGTRNHKIQSGQPGRILCNAGIAMREVPTALTRAEGDIHPLGNPHYVIDPVNAKIIAAHLADAFARLDSANAAAYHANASKFTATLDRKLAEWTAELAPFKGARVVSYHKSWPYFAARFGLQMDLFLEPKPGIPPSPAHLAAVIARMKEENARVIIVDPYLNRKTAETVARSTGATVVDVAQMPGGVKGTEGGYVALLDYLVQTLAQALGAQK
ncbi:MAG TPA: metal ABC transporter substrate-binding protein [Verrucomicrobiota bacterium]|nr:metal ABC transporter substrate-binding protein [Verrucomicrobiota bacterium]